MEECGHELSREGELAFFAIQQLYEVLSELKTSYYERYKEGWSWSDGADRIASATGSGGFFVEGAGLRSLNGNNEAASTGGLTFHSPNISRID
jgi:hypothetical protein